MSSDATIRRMRALLKAYRFQNLQLAEWYFAGDDEDKLVDTPLFGGQLPIRVGRSVTHKLLCLQQERFIPERFLVSRLLSPGDCVVDVGANIGYYLLMLLQRVGPTGRVVCVEPEPTNLSELRRCIELNAAGNVELIEAAVGEADGRIALRPGLNGRIAEEGVSVPVIRLDTLLDRRPALVKIDIEGFEGQALRGMPEMMREVSPRLFIEMHPSHLKYGISAREIYESVRAIYPGVSFWEQPESEPFLSKLRSRYVSEQAVRRIADARGLLARCDSGERTQTFWMVCEPAGGSRLPQG